MTTIVKNDLSIVRLEDIIVSFTIDQPILSGDVFACIRKYPNDVNYITAFTITADTEERSASITMKASSEQLDVGWYYYDVWLWLNDKPSRCLIQGRIVVTEGISNRGKV